ncbi:hypothetical protein EDD11_003462, partial [Mortierella claussenii]
MAANTLTLFCVISGGLASNAFPVQISSDETVGVLKNAIKANQTPAFDNIDANDLVVWCVTIPVDEDADDEIITAAKVNAKRLLKGTATLSRAFNDLKKDTIHIIIERPKVAAARKRTPSEAFPSGT